MTTSTIDVKEKMPGRIQHEGLSALRSANQSAEAAGLADMTLDEINAEIAAARQERGQQVQRDSLQ